MATKKNPEAIPLDGYEEPVQLDAVLHKLGAFGKHQLITMCMLALVYATNSMYNVNYVFAVEDVNYRCKVPECESVGSPFIVRWLNASAAELDSDGLKQCQQHPPLSSQCHAFNTSALRDCKDWAYEVPNSFVAEFGLACEEWKPPLVGTIHSFGSMIGLLIQGQISDRLRVDRAGAVHDVRDAGHVLVQHSVHVHVGAVPHLHAQLHALHLLGVRPRRLLDRAADSAANDILDRSASTYIRPDVSTIWRSDTVHA